MSKFSPASLDELIKRDIAFMQKQLRDRYGHEDSANDCTSPAPAESCEDSRGDKVESANDEKTH